MRKITLSLIATTIALAAPMFANAQTAAPAAPAASSAAPAVSSSATAHAKYSTNETEIGTLLDDPIAKAIIEKNIPGFTTNDQVDMARAMTLKQVQQYAPDDVTDAVLAKIDAEFAALK
jgi:para-nitrobenzyl esterase